ncbi:acetyltransferase [Galbibacter orientalis DSM 19592]|uniref:Acetyltransferase n=2 Tax=Galbibacter TaxID=379068 RepID=I3C319_9FLAO|nr:GNAT family N-acetyltransferase [Galbibacter orientalis]EIJ38012.1 acetyltransferase [Galbibacter orientalis DSM 19592]|tara:strand:- start:253 stop:756 length:504 start_codon:yes stop_codon:yes gene_type:complete
MSQLSEPLNSKHKKSEFSCGKEMLDTYIQKQANQDVKRKLSVCFVINEIETNLIKGYYTLSNTSVSSDFIPNQIRNKLPKAYNSIPATLLGRLAIDNRFQGQGIGKYLLIDALKRSYEISKTIASFAVVVDPIDQDAENFYNKYGFIKLPDSGKMFLPMKTISQLFE